MSRIRQTISANWLLIGIMAVPVLAITAGLVLLAVQEDGEWVSPMERECLQPLRDSWAAGDPDFTVLDTCEHGDGRQSAMFGPDEVRREWTMWQGRERAWIVAEAVKDSSNVSAEQIQDMIDAAVGSGVAETNETASG